jgi:hypothetical protein
MSSYRPCPPAPGPLEAYAVQFDSLFNRLSQRQSFSTYLGVCAAEHFGSSK